MIEHCILGVAILIGLLQARELSAIRIENHRLRQALDARRRAYHRRATWCREQHEDRYA